MGTKTDRTHRKAASLQRALFDEHTLSGSWEHAYTDADEDIKLQTLMSRLPSKAGYLSSVTVSLAQAVMTHALE